MAMTSSCFANTLSFMKQIESDWNLESRLKAQIQTLRLKASFLKALFSCTGKWKIDDTNLKVLLWHIQTVILNADKDLQMVYSELTHVPSQEYQSIPANLRGLITNSLLKLEIINPDIHDVYTILSKSTRSITCSTTDAVVESVDVLLENVKDLLSYKAHSIVLLKREIESLEQNLRHLKHFLGIMKSWCSDQENLKDFLTHAEPLADNLACLLFLCSEESKMDEEMANEMKIQLTFQVQMLKPTDPDVREIYTEALKVLKSSGPSIFLVDEHVLGFLDSLLAKMMELSDFKASSIIVELDQLEYLHEELKILRYFLLDPSALKYTENHPKVVNVLLRIKSAVCEAACFIYSSYDHNTTEDNAGQLNLAIYDLLQEFKVIKVEARYIFDEIIPISVRSNFPKTNEQGFINFVIRNLKELINSQDDSISQLQHQIETAHGNILSLRSHFIEVTDQVREQEELKDPWKRFKDIIYKTDYVIDSFTLREEPLWYHKLGLFDIMEEIKTIRREIDDIKEEGD